MKKYVISIALAVIIVSTGKSQEVEYSFSDVYPISKPATLTVSSSDGDIDVSTSNSDKINVNYSLERNNKPITMTREELANEGITIEAIHDNNSLQLSISYPNNYYRLNHTKRINVNLNITVPVQTACNLKTSDGDMKVCKLEADLTCRTSDGRTNINDIKGNVTAKSSDGRINIKNITGNVAIIGSDARITCSDIDGNFDVKSSDGGIFLGHINGNVNCKSSDGRIEISDSKGQFNIKSSDGGILFSNLTGSLNAISSDGGVKGNIVELKDHLNIKTSDGRIEITIPDTGLDLEASGNIGDVPKNNFSGEIEKRHIKGKVNGGGIPVNLATSDGRINLAYK